MTKKLEFRIERTIDQHILVFFLLVVFLISVWASDGFAVGNNCHALNPSIDCGQKGTINRSDVMNSCWVNVSILSTHGMDEYRELPSCGNGFEHAIFAKNSQVGTFHLDKYNALAFPLGSVDHFAVFVSMSTGIEQSIVTIMIWGVAFFGTYYIIKDVRFIAKKLHI